MYINDCTAWSNCAEEPKVELLDSLVSVNRAPVLTEADVGRTIELSKGKVPSMCIHVFIDTLRICIQMYIDMCVDMCIFMSVLQAQMCIAMSICMWGHARRHIYIHLSACLS